MRYWPVTRSFDVFFELRLNKRLRKQWWCWWFDTPSRPLWRHSNGCDGRGVLSCVRGAFPIIGRMVIYYIDVVMTTIASQITSLTVVYSTVSSDADQRKHQSSASLAFVWGIHRDRWIPRTKGQLRGKCFYLMTSSWLPAYGHAFYHLYGHNNVLTWLNKPITFLRAALRWQHLRRYCILIIMTYIFLRDIISTRWAR